MEVRSSPQPKDNGFPFEDFIHDPDEIEMNENGYHFVTSSPVELAKDLEQWQKFMEYGINLDVALLRYLGTARGVFRQGPVLASSASDTGTSLRKAHPCRCAISIWRPMRGSIGPEHGLFKVYPGSHHLNTEDELRSSEIQAVDMQIHADQTAFLLWMGISTEIIGLHIDKYCLEFVALAHGASRFLLRHQPPEIEIPPAPEPSRPISRQLGTPSQRSGTAIQFLESALSSLPQIIDFIEKLQDPPGIILQRYYTAHNATVTFLSVGHDIDPENWFLHAILRGTIKDFVQEEGLPETTQKVILNGQKVHWLEQTLDSPGIWLVLMGVFSRLGRLPSQELIYAGELILGYRDVLEKASEWSQLVDNCSRPYSILVLGL
ncbi:hypothetical protein BDW62DRAFT_216428 [Aspergillus aurantiobrunneus]